VKWGQNLKRGRRKVLVEPEGVGKQGWKKSETRKRRGGTQSLSGFKTVDGWGVGGCVAGPRCRVADPRRKNKKD